jgi:hypothetical protein
VPKRGREDSLFFRRMMTAYEGRTGTGDPPLLAAPSSSMCIPSSSISRSVFISSGVPARMYDRTAARFGHSPGHAALDTRASR